MHIEDIQRLVTEEIKIEKLCVVLQLVRRWEQYSHHLYASHRFPASRTGLAPL